MPQNPTADMSTFEPIHTADMSTFEPLPPKGVMERYWEGLKSAVPALSGKSYTDVAQQQLQEAQGAHLPTWEDLKAGFKASPIGKAVSGDVAGALGAATPLAAMGAVGAKGEAISEAGPAVARGAAKAVNTGLDLAPAAGTALGTALGHDQGGGWVGGAVGGVAGNLVGRAISAIPRIPVTEPVTAAPPRTAIPVSAYKTISRANPALNDSQIRATYQDFLKDQPARPVRVAVEQQPQAVQEAVSPVIDAKIPDGPINEAAKTVAGSALAAGDSAHAQAVVAAAEDLSQTVPAKAQGKLKWEDILDDAAWKQRMEDDLQNQQSASWTYKSRLNRAAASAASNKGSLLTPEQAVQSMPAPAGTMEANKLLGYEGRRTVPQATAVRNQALAGKPQAALKDFVRMQYGQSNELSPVSTGQSPVSNFTEQLKQSLAATPEVASVPMFITKGLEAKLKGLGYSQKQINKMTPADAWEKVKPTQ